MSTLKIILGLMVLAMGAAKGPMHPVSGIIQMCCGAIVTALAIEKAGRIKKEMAELVKELEEQR